MKQHNIWWRILTLTIILLGAWILYAKTVLNHPPMESLLKIPKDGRTDIEQKTGEPPSIMDIEANSLARTPKDPFKAFLDNKEKSHQVVILQSEPTYPPGVDPFKAKLEEKKNEPHSAVSPFSK